MEILKNYKPLCFLNNKKLVIEKEYSIYLYDLKNKELNFFCQLEISKIKLFLSKISLIKRLLRLGTHYSIYTDNLLLVCYDRKIVRIDLSTKIAKVVHNIDKGKSPLNMTVVKNNRYFNDGVYFGEYFISNKKEDVNIFFQPANSESFKIIYTFKKGLINHIHSLVEDKINNCIWILTGDFDNSYGIWKAENKFKKVEPVLIGKQIFRSCVAVPTHEGLLYTTDSNIEVNSLRILHKVDNSWQSSFIDEINGSCIYGCKIDNLFIFSTTTEPAPPKNSNSFLYFLSRKPGKGILSNISKIYSYNIDNKRLDVVYENRKDWLPYGLFQFGTIMFPTGQGPSNILVCYSVGNKTADMSTIILNLK